MSTLICYDGSPNAKRALSVAASAVDGAPAVLLNVWNAPERVLADSFGITEQDASLIVTGTHGTTAVQVRPAGQRVQRARASRPAPGSGRPHPRPRRRLDAAVATITAHRP